MHPCAANWRELPPRKRSTLDAQPQSLCYYRRPRRGQDHGSPGIEKHGFSHAPEVARQIIQEQVRNNGAALPWADRKLYIELMLSRSIESYNRHTPVAKPMFADRGIPDTLAYARLIGLAAQPEIRIACEQYRYASRVFVAPPWKEIYETDSERRQDFAEAKRTYWGLVSTYQECGYETIQLPKSSPPQRAVFILNHLQLT